MIAFRLPTNYLKEKYGHPSEVADPSEVAGSYVRNIIDLPCITERDVYEQLLFHESLETLGKRDTIQGASYKVVKKLEIVKPE